MYNSEVKDSQAYWACREFIECQQGVESANDGMETAVENAVNLIAELEEQLQELETERDDLQTEVDKMTDMLKNFDPEQVLGLLKRLEVAATTMVNFSVNTEATVRKAYGLAEDSTDGSGGSGSHGSPESNNDTGAGETTT